MQYYPIDPQALKFFFIYNPMINFGNRRSAIADKALSLYGPGMIVGKQIQGG